MSDVRVPLCVLSVRTSQRSNRKYVTGWLGQSKVIGWAGEQDKWGNETIALFLTPHEPKPEPRRMPAAINGDVLAPDPEIEWNGR